MNDMLIQVPRFSGAKEDTLGLMFIDNQWEGFTLEDEYREIKVDGETRISNGLYEIKLQTEGRLHEKYLELFPDMHVGMLTLQDVPNFTGIMLHIGNEEDHTDGCPLIGDTSSQNRTKRGAVGQSTACYKRLYPKIAQRLVKGGRVFINLFDIELPEVELPRTNFVEEEAPKRGGKEVKKEIGDPK